MLVAYNSQLIRDICFHKDAAIESLGEAAALELQSRHPEIMAAQNIDDLILGKRVVSNASCKWLSGLLEITMIPNYGVLKDDEYFDWSDVKRVKIVGINGCE